MNSTVHPFLGDASILAHCLRAKLAQGMPHEAAMHEAFKVATGRAFGTHAQDVEHMAAALDVVGRVVFNKDGRAVRVTVPQK